MTAVPSESDPPSPYITSYDLIKAFAVVIMIIDHVGAYYFPGENWWRAVGRVGFPIWFFLVGYSTGRAIPPLLWGGAIALLGVNLLTGSYLFPLNALFTIILIRLSIDKIMEPVVTGRWLIWIFGAIFFVIAIPTMLVSEYGTQALITAMFGYAVRHRDRFPNPNTVFDFMVFAFVTFVATQYLTYNFTLPQIACVILGTLAVRYVLYNFKPCYFLDLHEKLPGVLTRLIRFMGKRTLEIYIAHLILFKLTAPYVLDKPIKWFEFSLFFS